MNQIFPIKTILENTAIIISPLYESQIRDYMVQHFQMGPERIAVATFFNPLIFVS
ncbi:hypothetical protein [Streptococcus varani]|uniref:hypothetical protein n=1 Tax=Streptococcus varani TaxID=1608583 RepID=UPI000ACE3ACA|nr:hypothetical protein [Streptococcus varani]